MCDGLAAFQARIKELADLHSGLLLLGLKYGNSISILFINEEYQEPAYKFESEQEVLDHFQLTDRPLNFYKNGYLWAKSDEIRQMVSQAAMSFYYESDLVKNVFSLTQFE